MHPSQAPYLINAVNVLGGRMLFVDVTILFILALWVLIIQSLKGNSNAPDQFLKFIDKAQTENSGRLNFCCKAKRVFRTGPFILFSSQPSVYDIETI